MLQSMNLMIYVDDVEKVAAFFEQAAGTPRISEETMIDGSKTITVPVLPEASLQFYSRNFIQKYSPEVALNSPSIMFYVDDLASAHARLLRPLMRSFWWAVSRRSILPIQRAIGTQLLKKTFKSWLPLTLVECRSRRRLTDK
ncbi:hypothetical protein [Limosilactobacillus mucosae]|uniref:hypothetical protein n=1 Tax=Limosilactobacillus mucosae TaxID=97478 RepID=UPI00233ED7D0|nr:hypothetical protein [Limosilactobacillus mucosae]MDC2843204.1 hypothetical protein [Limosilactobacillus mucosae]